MLLMKDILQEGNPILRKRSINALFPLTDEDRETLRLMMEYIVNSQNGETSEKYGLRPAVGLAAPQIGVNRKLFCMHTPDETGKSMHSYAVLNPTIISFSEEQTYLGSGEGCLSVPEDENGLVSRSKRIKVRTYLVDLETGKTEKVMLKLTGYPAIVFQHEYDHLQGILFVDKVKKDLPGIRPVVFASSEAE